MAIKIVLACAGSISLMTFFIITPFTSPEGARWAMFQLMTIFISYFGYLPFLMKVDKQAYQNELSAMEN